MDERRPPAATAGDDSARRHRRATELFLELVELPEEARHSALDRLAGDEPELAREVELLLAADAATASHPLDRPAFALAEEPGDSAPPATVAGERSYRLLSELGRGGMGVVHLAERSDGEFRQRVAIKLLSGGAARGESLVRRFRTERQILAALDHPGIAKLLDGGTLADGTPYLVMEHVEGVRIDEYCRERALSTAERLRLFLGVCAAVEAAHQRLVVHRDLKPGNILVTADGAPKLLDFGIAKLLGPLGDDWTAAETEHGGSPHTLRYASPEQVRGEPVSTATDVYSLGVVLYELLTGSGPFGDDLSAPELLRAITDREPRTPSAVVTRGSGRGAEAPEPDRRRRAELSGDLDAILLKALRKGPGERYGSVESLAEDLRRHLDGRPVEARRSTLAYRTARFVSRHKLPVAAAALLVAVLASWAVSLGRQLERTRVERDKANRVTEFMVDLFELADPSESRGATVTVHEALERGAARIDRELVGQVETRAALLDAVGRVYFNLGSYRRSQDLLARAVEARRSSGTPAELATTLLHLAEAAHVGGDLDRADQAYRDSRNQAERSGDPALVARVLSSHASLVLDREGADRSEPLFVEARDRLRSRPVPEDLDLAQVEIQLALIRLHRDVAAAQAGIAEALALLERSGGKEPIRAATIRGEVALALRELGEPQRAAELLEKAVELLRSVVPGDHAELANLLNTQAIVFADLGDLPAATAAFEQSIEMWTRLSDAENPRVALATGNLGTLYLRRGDWWRATELLERALANARRTLPPDHPDLAVYLENLADAALERGEASVADRYLDDAGRILSSQFEIPHAGLARHQARRARHLARRGELARAETAARDALAAYRVTLAADSPAVGAARVILGRILMDRGSWQEARPLLEESLAGRERVHGATHYETAHVRSLFGETLFELGERRRGEELIQTALAAQSRALLPWHFALVESRERLARALAARGEEAQATVLLREAQVELGRVFPAEHPLVMRVGAELALLRGSGRPRTGPDGSRSPDDASSR